MVGVLVVVGSPDALADSTVVLNAGHASPFPTVSSVDGVAPNGDVLYAAGGNSLSPAQATPKVALESSGASTQLPTLSGFGKANLVGTFAVNTNFSTANGGIVFVDTAHPATAGTDPIPANDSFVYGGPAGWVLYNSANGHLDYVQPSGTGDNAPTTTTQIGSLPTGNRVDIDSASANTAGLVLATSIGGGHSVMYFPFDASGAKTLAAAGWQSANADFPSLGQVLSALTCPTTTLCVAGDQLGGLLISTNPTGGAGTWSSPVMIDQNGINAIACPTTTLCVASDVSGNVVTSTNPTGGAGAWSAPVKVDTNGLLTLSCPMTTLCVAGDFNGAVVASTNPTGGADAWTMLSGVDANGINRIACASATLCVAADGTGNILTSTSPATSPSTWSSPANIAVAPVTDVSCPTTSLCVAVDAAGDVHTSTTPTDSSSWTDDNVDLMNFVSVSCPTTALCVASDGGGDVVTSTNPTGGAPAWASPKSVDSSLFGQLLVACPSTTLCVGADDNGQVLSSTTPTSSWSSPAVFDAAPTGQSMLALSCPTTTFCAATDRRGGVVTSTDPTSGTWSNPAQIGSGNVPAIACPSATLCVAADSHGDFHASTNPGGGAGAWTTTANVDQNGRVTSISCPSTTLCLAVDDGGSVFTSTTPATGGWTSTSIVGASLYGISCPSTTLCVAVDDTGRVLTSTNPAGGAGAWSAPSTVDAGNSLTTVSCPTTALCVAADTFGGIVTSTIPTGGAAAWHLAANADPDGITALSCPTTTLCLAGDFYGSVATSTNPTGGAAAWSTPSTIGSNTIGGVACPSMSVCVAVDGAGHAITTTAPTQQVDTMAPVAVDEGGDVTYTIGNFSGPPWSVVRSTVAAPDTKTTLTVSTSYIGSLAVTAGRTAWLPLNLDLVFAPAGTTTQQTITGPFDTLGGNGTTLAVSRSDSVGADGIYTIADGSTTPTSVVPLGAQPAATTEVAVSPGRVAYRDDDVAANATGGWATWSRSLTSDRTNVTAGSPSLVADGATGYSLSISGQRTLSSPPSGALNVYTPSGVTQVSAAAATFSLPATLSGTRALYREVVNGDPVWRLYDLRTKTARTLSGVSGLYVATLFGDYVTYPKPTGEIDRLNVATNTTIVVAASPSLPTGTTRFVSAIAAHGDGTAWQYDDCSPNSCTDPAVVYAAHPAATPISETSSDGGPAQVALSGDYLVSSHSGVLQIVKLSDSTVATGPATDTAVTQGRQFGLSGSVLAYDSSDGNATATQLTPDGNDAPIDLGNHGPTAYVNPNVAPWSFDAVTSAPLTSCSVGIKHSTTTVVTLPCDAAAMADGEAVASWNGKTSAGAVVGDGVYTWTLSAGNVDGSLVNENLTSAATTGTVDLDRTAPAPVVKTPSHPFQMSRTVAVSFGASDATSGVLNYDVRYRTAAWNKGFGTYAAPTTWQKLTTTSKTLTTAATPGTTYCFGVRARDRAGNVSGWTRDKCTALPVDDRSLTALTSGWVRAKSSADYLGTETDTKASAKSLRIVGAQVVRVDLLVTRCATCGSIAVYLNGRYWKTVSTYYAKTQRQYLIALPLVTLRTATIILKTTTLNRAVIVDGLGLSRA